MLNQIASFKDAFTILSKLPLDDFLRIKEIIPSIEQKISNEVDARLDGKIICPFCRNEIIKKNGKSKKGVQKYQCLHNECKKYFYETTHTLLSKTKKLKENLPLVLLSILNKDTIRESAKIMNVNIATAYSWRIKVLECFKKIDDSSILKEKIEVDETFVPINLKGTKPKNMPRPSKKRGGTTVSRRENICIETAIDSNDFLVMRIAGVAMIRANLLEKVLGDKVLSGSIFVGDGANAYNNFCKRHCLTYEQVEPEKHLSANGENMNTVNGIHSEFKTFLKSFKGISSRHLPNYIDWFRVSKYLKYHIESINQFSCLNQKVLSCKLKKSFSSCFKKQQSIQLYAIYRHKGIHSSYLERKL